MRRTIITLILLTVVCAAGAQNRVTVSGYIKDKNSGESLPGAVATYGPGTGSATNGYGYYSMSVPAGDIILSYSYLGFETHEMTLQLRKDTTLNVFLSPLEMTMDEVVVIGKQPLVTQRDLGNVSVNVSQLKYTPLFLGEQDIFKYLQILPGVSSGKEGSSGLNIRGGSSDQTQILLDEVPIYNQSHAFGKDTPLPPMAVGFQDLQRLSCVTVTVMSITSRSR